MPDPRPKVVVIGGGTGCPAILRGLKGHPVDLTAIVTTMDSGGSSGRLRQEFNVPALGDIRRALAALTDDDALGSLSEYRFRGESSLEGHTLGNLTLLALLLERGDLEEAVERLGSMMGIRGAVLPVTSDYVNLCALLKDGQTLVGEASIDLRGHSPVGVERVYLSEPATATEKAVSALLEADAIVIGPGDLYTSVIPNLLVDGIATAIQSSDAKRIFVGNLVTKPGETEGYKLSDFLNEVLRYTGLTDWLDAVIVDSGHDTGNPRAGELFAGNPLVETDDEACQELAGQIMRRDVAMADSPWLHDSAHAANAIMEAINS
jgi:uncharacterized cofD-like protein